MESLKMIKIYLFKKVKEWKSSPQINWHKENRRKELIRAILIYPVGIIERKSSLRGLFEDFINFS